MKQELGLPKPANDDDNLAYIKSMLGELHGMARSANLVMLAYLIDMAHYEATDEQSRRGGGGRQN